MKISEYTATFQQSIYAFDQISRSSKYVVITTHINPDGDALGSALGLYAYFLELGIPAKVINHSPTPKNLQFLPNSDIIEVFDEKIHSDTYYYADLIIICDLNDYARTGLPAQSILQSSAKKIVIDHHQDPKADADIFCWDTEASSTCQIIAEILFQLRPEHITSDIATCLYTGIITDSGNFRHPRTTKKLLSLAGELIDRGAIPWTISDNVYNQNSANRQKLLGEAFASLELHCAGRVCIMKITDSMLLGTQCSIEDTEGFAEQTLTIQGVMLGILICEVSPNTDNGLSLLKMSFRSRGETSALEIAQTFGGGGHFHAAGARTNNFTIKTLQNDILQKAEKLFEE